MCDDIDADVDRLSYHRGESGVRILQATRNLILLNYGLDLAYQSYNRVILFVRLAESSLECGVCVH